MFFKLKNNIQKNNGEKFSCESTLAFMIFIKNKLKSKYSIYLYSKIATLPTRLHLFMWFYCLLNSMIVSLFIAVYPKKHAACDGLSISI